MGPGVNLATTKDGGTYNKLQRPLDYLMSPTAPPPPPPPKNTPLADTTCASKRKLEHANFAPTSKRTRTGEDSTRVRSLQSGIASKEQSRVLDCGMKTTLPGLDDERYSSDEETSEALAYLRNVRSEASAIPQLLVASTTRNDNIHRHNQQVLYSDGIYIAVDGHDASSAPGSTEETNFLDPQNCQCQLLLKRFCNLRTTLAAIADKKHVLTMRADEELADMVMPLKRRRGWLDILDSEFPRLDLIVQLEKKIVHCGLESCAAYLETAASISPQASTWMWALLASVADMRSCDNESRIRTLGQKAGVLGVRLWGNVGVERITHSGEHKRIDRDDELGASESFVKPVAAIESDGEVAISTHEEQSRHGMELTDLEQARARLLSQLGDRLVQPELPSQETFLETSKTQDSYAMTGGTRGRTDDTASITSTSHNALGSDAMSESSQHMSSLLQQEHEEQNNGEQDSDTEAKCSNPGGYAIDLNTRVTIDMIVTIAAEYFGQRDLLEYRKAW